jgi:hypothetical protein
MYDQAFLMAGTAFRMTQALQLNLESDRDVLCVFNEPDRLSALEKEVRRRLMWAVYLADANIASGVNQLKLIISEDLQVQLPTHDHNFLHQVPAVTQRVHMFGSNPERLPLAPIEQLDSEQPQPSTSQMGLQAYFIRMRYVKSQILSYIKKVSKTLPPWDKLSSFQSLADDLDSLCSSLPPAIQYTATSIRLYQGTADLAAFYALHLGIDQCFCDLFRLAIPDACFPAQPIAELLEQAPPRFVDSVRDKLFRRAQHQSTLIGDLARLQDETAVADWGIGIHAHEAVKYQVIFVMTASQDDTKRASAILDIMPAVEDSFRVLQCLSTYYGQMASKFLLSLFKLFVDHSFPVDILSSYLTRTMNLDSQVELEADPTREMSSDSDPESLSEGQRSIDGTLHPLSLFALVRSTLHPREKHVPEKSRRCSRIAESSCSAVSANSDNTNPQRPKQVSEANCKSPHRRYPMEIIPLRIIIGASFSASSTSLSKSFQAISRASLVLIKKASFDKNAH